MQIPNHKVTLHHKYHQIYTPLKSTNITNTDIPPLILTDAKQQIDKKHQAATKQTNMPNTTYKNLIAKKYHKGNIVILYQDSDPDQNNSWIPLQETNLSKKEISQLPWRTLSGRNTTRRI